MRKSLAIIAGLSCTLLVSCTHHHTAPATATPAPVAQPAPAAPPVPPPVAPVIPPPPVAPATPAAGTVYVPDLTHAAEPMQANSLTWNNLTEAVDVPADSAKAQFLFTFTNVSDKAFAITTVHPSCGCTTAKIPALPWLIPPGGTGEIPISVNIAGKNGMVFKTVYIASERGSQTLTLRINIAPPIVRILTDAERIQGMQLAKVDRQAVFKGDCATCHAKNVQGKYSKDLYDSVCGICHDSPNRATMVPDLHKLTVPTNVDFWQTWINFGKAGTLMPGFAASQGGPLNDVQISSLAAYLNASIPSHVAQQAQ